MNEQVNYAKIQRIQDDLEALTIGQFGTGFVTDAMLYESGIKATVAQHTTDLADIVYIVRPTGNDDTTLINSAINTVSTSTRLKKVVLDGAFKVSTTNYGDGITMKSNVILEFTPGSKISLTTGNFQGYQIISCKEINNFKIINPYVVGDRDTNTQSTGEWGHGISVQGCKQFELKNVYVEKCWGDGVVIGNSNAIISEDFYIDKIHVYKCRRNGVTIASAKDARIDYIQCENIDGTLPKAALDIESNAQNEVWNNIKIGEVRSYLCLGGVQIQPLTMATYSYVSTIDITIDKIKILGNDTSDTGNFIINGADETKIQGNIRIGYLYVNKTDRALYITNVHNGGVNVGIDHLEIISTTTGDTYGMTNQSGIYVAVDTNKRATKNIGNILIKNCNFSGNAPYFLNAIAQNSGTIELSNFKIYHLLSTITVPMRIDGILHDVIRDIEGIEVNIGLLSTTYNVGQPWFTNHFLSSKYVNDNATTGLYVAPSGSINLKNNVIVLENRVDTKYIGADLTGRTIYPASLNFVNGFKSNTVGSRIKFIQKADGKVIVVEKTGDWVTY